MKLMKKQLIELLNITAYSGGEKPVRDYLHPILSELVDDVVIDNNGNLLGEKVYGSGKGAKLLLSAHMDTVDNVMPNRKLIEKNGVIRASNSAIGGDCRAGISIILAVLRNVPKSFNGVIKVAFSRDEEIGCLGANKIDPKWYEDIDLAVVVDRRGNRDIVVGNYKMPFCSNGVGELMENVGQLLDMQWHCVEGGVSDAMVFANNGINSINLSAGFYNEHTYKEYVVLDDVRDTITFIVQILAVINDFRGDFGVVPEENKWVKSYHNRGMNNYSYGYIPDDYIYAEEFDENGNVYVFNEGEYVVIQQVENEIVLSRESLRALLEQLERQL